MAIFIDCYINNHVLRFTHHGSRALSRWHKEQPEILGLQTR